MEDQNGCDFTLDSQARQPMGSGFEAAFDDVTGAARPVVDRAAGHAHAVVDRVAAAAGKAGAALNRQGEQFGRTGDRVASRSRGYIIGNPLTSLGMAAAAGFVLSLLMRQR